MICRMHQEWDLRWNLMSRGSTQEVVLVQVVGKKSDISNSRAQPQIKSQSISNGNENQNQKLQYAEVIKIHIPLKYREIDDFDDSYSDTESEGSYKLKQNILYSLTLQEMLFNQGIIQQEESRLIGQSLCESEYLSDGLINDLNSSEELSQGGSIQFSDEKDFQVKDEQQSIQDFFGKGVAVAAIAQKIQSKGKKFLKQATVFNEADNSLNVSSANNSLIVSNNQSLLQSEYLTNKYDRLLNINETLFVQPTKLINDILKIEENDLLQEQNTCQVGGLNQTLILSDNDEESNFLLDKQSQVMDQMLYMGKL
ncbi:UNKNOWN [Stylonychia lemnae]|uniref:Uncharacterized protein n=1 Tax=Stylonychia lemnae TaxID=5949 RepID=A0A078AVE1_STYLE|nr:UNKNOWN [Stylonychia lemnae]|eukprot:CDW86011.1 UNKNOWN [Stylonychia lemnae]